MTGIDRITADIKDEAQKKADGILTDAKERAAEALAMAKERGEKEVQNAVASAEREAGAMEERSRSRADLGRRQALLSAKQEVIESTIQKAYQRLVDLPDESYFSMIRKLLEKNVKAEEGTICFSAKDLARLPADFDNTIHAIAAEKGGSLTLETEPVPIDNGFLLKYGGIEENCTLAAIFAAQKDRMTDMVHTALW